MTVGLKFTGPDTIEGLAIPFGGPDDLDVDGEFFTAKTDFCIDWFGKSGRPILYDHGTDSALGPMVIGRQTDYEEREDGIWAQAQLNRHARYRKGIDALIEQGALGYSSGAMAHLVTKNANGWLARWPWVELSPTPIPASPQTLGVHYVKSADLIAHMEAVEVDIPAPLKAALSALDEWAESRDESLPAGVKFADNADRLLVDVTAFRDRMLGLSDLRAKAGRVLSAATRDRLTTHPAALRQLADDLDELLSTADAGKSALIQTLLAIEVQRAQRLGVVNPVKSASDDVGTATFALNSVLSLIESESEDLDPEDPDYADDQADVTLLGTARDALTEYISSTAKEVGSADDQADDAEEDAAESSAMQGM